MSTAPVPAKRHALGLPAGSVRATHVLGVVALVCALILIPTARSIPPYLIYLLFLMLGHYFGSHGVTIAMRDDPAPSPLFLPGGTVRILIVLALVAAIAWSVYQDPTAFYNKFEASLQALANQPLLPVAILGGFLVGVIVRAFMGRNPSPTWQDVEAWISIVALVGLAIAALLHIFVEPSEGAEEMLRTIDPYFGAVLAFYFGERS